MSPALDLPPPHAPQDFDTLLILLLDENDNYPLFTEDTYHAEVMENSPAGRCLAHAGHRVPRPLGPLGQQLHCGADPAQRVWRSWVGSGDRSHMGHQRATIWPGVTAVVTGPGAYRTAVLSPQRLSSVKRGSREGGLLTAICTSNHGILSPHSTDSYCSL